VTAEVEGDPGAAVRSRLGHATEDVEPLYISLLGAFEVRVGTRVVPTESWYLRRAKSLIKMLTLAPGRRLHRGEIVDALWPGMTFESAVNNLHKVIYVARRSLEPDLLPNTGSSYVRFHGDLVALESEAGIFTDVEDFRLAAIQALGSGDPTLHERALSLYTGPLLPEDRYEDWVLRERSALEELHQSVLLDLASLHESRGDLEPALEALRRVIAIDEAHEQAHVAVMRLYAATGQRQLALRQFHQLAAALREELDAEPDPSTVAIYQRILQGEFDSPVARTVTKDPGAPAREPSEAPREDILSGCRRSIDQLFLGVGGVIVLMGPAGIGKSWVARKIAEEAGSRGALTMWSAAYPETQTRPYGLFGAALDGISLRVPPKSLAHLIGTFEKELGMLAPTIGRVMGYYPEPLNESRIFAALTYVLARMSQLAPSVLVLEDVQHADERSLEFLAHLARIVEGFPLLVVCTVRDDELATNQVLTWLLQQFSESSATSTLRLEPLTIQDVTELVQSLLNGQAETGIIEAVLEASEGIPHFVEEAVFALRGRGLIRCIDGTWRLQSSAGSLRRGTLRDRPEAAGDYQLSRHLRESRSRSSAQASERDSA